MARTEGSHIPVCIWVTVFNNKVISCGITIFASSYSLSVINIGIMKLGSYTNYSTLGIHIDLSLLKFKCYIINIHPQHYSHTYKT